MSDSALAGLLSQHDPAIAETLYNSRNHYYRVPRL